MKTEDSSQKIGDSRQKTGDSRQKTGDRIRTKKLKGKLLLFPD